MTAWLSNISLGRHNKVLFSVSHTQKSGKFLSVWVVSTRAQKFYRHRNDVLWDITIEHISILGPVFGFPQKEGR